MLRTPKGESIERTEEYMKRCLAFCLMVLREWAPKIARLWRTAGDIMAAWEVGRETINKPGGYPRG